MIAKDKEGVNVNVNVETLALDGDSLNLRNADDALLANLGYKAEFKREFSVSKIARLTSSDST